MNLAQLLLYYHKGDSVFTGTETRKIKLRRRTRGLTTANATYRQAYMRLLEYSGSETRNHPTFLYTRFFLSTCMSAGCGVLLLTFLMLSLACSLDSSAGTVAVTAMPPRRPNIWSLTVKSALFPRLQKYPPDYTGQCAVSFSCVGCA